MKKILCLLLASLTLLLAGCGISDQEVMDSIPTLVIQAKSDIKKLPTFGYDWTVTGRWGNGTSVIADTAHPLEAQNDGRVIRLAFPQLTEERRKELVKQIAKYAEGGKVAIRNIRRDAVDAFKTQKKNGELTEDDLKIAEKDIQKMTDDMCKELDALLEKKEKELLAG